MVAPIVVATAPTTASSTSGDGKLLFTTTPSTPSKQLHKEAELDNSVIL
jgi:hypothetical protein